MRVGIGYDVHRFAEGRRLMLGGVHVPHPVGLIGHSDADVVLHAVTDALLGAAGLPDIGEQFPDHDPAYKDSDSAALLSKVVAMVRAHGYRAVNIDIVVHAEQPRLSPYKRPIAESIARLTELTPEAVSVKAKTNEGVGPIGHGDAVACTAVVLLTGTT